MPENDELFCPLTIFANSDEEPISINHAYTVFRGNLQLKKEGRNYKDRVADAVAKATTEWKIAHDVIYQYGGWAHLTLTLYFADLKNTSWKPGAMTKGGKNKPPQPQNPYKKKDSSNYIKLLEDAVARGSGLDDCNNLDVTIRKREDKAHPRIEIELQLFVNNRHDWEKLMKGRT